MTLELWGGVECTLNRVGDNYFDQFVFSGHEHRIDDLDWVAGLGLKTLRYRISWERVSPNGPDHFDWRWTDARMHRLRDLGIEPIVGFLHHGSGPRYTSLIDPGFPEKLARFAEAVARRYPWVTRYTPVNEPLTTARFSGLYGVWYPHGRDFHTMLRALFNQCRGTALAMDAIRLVNPTAALIQTEDLGHVSSTPELRYQADFENERRWLSLDLLTKNVSDRHPLWNRLLENGVTETELRWFAENPCPPALIGINHYPTSNRFLDHRMAGYPREFHGGNDRHAYADVESVRVAEAPVVDREALLRETWQRYRLPMAISECHLGSTRDEQMRWLKEAWDTGQRLRADGLDMRAVTVWSLLGVYYWNCLVTKCEGAYEPGALDIRRDGRRTTGLARMIASYAAGLEPSHPVLESPGWWTRENRYFYPRSSSLEAEYDVDRSTALARRAPLLITGGNGTLGDAFARLCDVRGIPYRRTFRNDMDIAHCDSVNRVMDDVEPWAVINAAGYVDVDRAERDFDRCHRENVLGAETLARATERHRLPLVTFSSDLVFDGDKRQPYVESSGVRPLNHYGRTKAEAERRVLDVHGGALVVRTSAFFGPWDGSNFLTQLFRSLGESRFFHALSDATVSPTYVPDLVNATLDLLIDGESGIWHLANSGATTWLEFAQTAARLAGFRVDPIRGCTLEEARLPAQRPVWSVLGSGKGDLMPSLDDALRRYLYHRQPLLSTAHAAQLAGVSGRPS